MVEYDINDFVNRNLQEGKTMKFAFLIMGDFDCKIDRAIIHDGTAQIIHRCSKYSRCVYGC